MRYVSLMVKWFGIVQDESWKWENQRSVSVEENRNHEETPSSVYERGCSQPISVIP